jgi:hypothetical protein
VRQHIRPERVVDPRHAVPALLATLAMLPAIAAGYWLLHHLAPDRLTTLAVLTATGTVATALFAAAVVLDGRRSARV